MNLDELDGPGPVLGTEDVEPLRDPQYLPFLREIHSVFGQDLERENDEGRNLFDEYKHGHLFYELWNQEYIDALAEYLAGRARQLGASAEKPLTILEVGAGDRRLSHFLGEVLDPTAHVKIIATDRDGWHYPIKPVFAVEQLDYRDALQKYQPQIVLSSWMPFNQDWTKSIRATETVQEYILIGEGSNGCCGSDETWGMPPDNEEGGSDWEGFVPKFKKEGFYSDRDALNEIDKYQICRTDSHAEGGAIHSATYSFKRGQAPDQS